LTTPADLPLRILTVCTHNRTRSVMMAALLDDLLTDRLGDGAVEISSSGFGPAGLPAIDDAVDAMQRRGPDVSAHRSSTPIVSLVDRADLILTAERKHVVEIAAPSIDDAPRVPLPGNRGGTRAGRRSAVLGAVAHRAANGRRLSARGRRRGVDPT
jgi:protein-tyrosine-phosphatase